MRYFTLPQCGAVRCGAVRYKVLVMALLLPVLSAVSGETICRTLEWCVLSPGGRAVCVVFVCVSVWGYSDIFEQHRLGLFFGEKIKKSLFFWFSEK